METLNDLIKIGGTVLYYNKWTGFENRDISSCFSQLNKKDISSLKIGDEIWRDEEPYDLNGKVYGYTRRVISDIKDSRIYFGTGGFSSFDLISGLYKLIPEKEEKLIQLMYKNEPVCFQIL